MQEEGEGRGWRREGLWCGRVRGWSQEEWRDRRGRWGCGQAMVGKGERGRMPMIDGVTRG